MTRILMTAAAVVLAAACNKSSFKGSAEKIHPTMTKEFTQDAYPVATKTYIQGHTGEPGTESFDQGEWGKLDLLIVVDNSGSMREEQANLATKMEPLLSHVEKSDWQVAVVTTDTLDGCQRALIKKNDPDRATRFQAAVNAGTRGDGTERGIFQAVEGLKCSTSPWLRDGSTVAVLLVTDEDNCHIDENQGYGCAGLADLNGAFLTDYLASVRTLKQDARVYGLLWHPSTPQSDCGTALKTADTYAGVIEATGGKWGSICDADYTNTLKAISEDVAKILKLEFDLRNDPDEGTLKVLVDGQEWNQFEQDGRKIKFTEPPPFGSKVEVSYRHGREGELATEFDLGKVPVGESVKIAINGEDAADGTYGWDEEKQKVIFTDAPAEKAELKVTFQEKVPLRETFEIGKDVNPKTIQVWVNGDKVSGFVYDAATGTVRIAPAPPAEAAIKISFKDIR